MTRRQVAVHPLTSDSDNPPRASIFHAPRALSRRLICGLRSIASLVRFVRLAWSVTGSYGRSLQLPFGFHFVLLTNIELLVATPLPPCRCTLVSTSDPLVSALSSALLRTAAGTLGPVAVIVKSCVSQSPVTPSLPAPPQQGSHCCFCHLHRHRSRFTLSPTSRNAAPREHTHHLPCLVGPTTTIRHPIHPRTSPSLPSACRAGTTCCSPGSSDFLSLPSRPRPLAVLSNVETTPRLHDDPNRSICFRPSILVAPWAHTDLA